jgi:hypothetical protein
MGQFLAVSGCAEGGLIHCDQGGKLAQCPEFCTTMKQDYRYKVEPTGADSPSQNGAVEIFNLTLAGLVRTLLYGASLPAKYWSAALVHAVYITNRTVHSITKCTPFEAWVGTKPNLQHLKVFGSRVCVKKPGKQWAKLDQHDFTGIFLGYIATSKNIVYIDIHSG